MPILLQQSSGEVKFLYYLEEQDRNIVVHDQNEGTSIKDDKDDSFRPFSHQNVIEAALCPAMAACMSSVIDARHYRQTLCVFIVSSVILFS